MSEEKELITEAAIATAAADVFIDNSNSGKAILELAKELRWSIDYHRNKLEILIEQLNHVAQ